MKLANTNVNTTVNEIMTFFEANLSLIASSFLVQKKHIELIKKAGPPFSKAASFLFRIPGFPPLLHNRFGFLYAKIVQNHLVVPEMIKVSKILKDYIN
jgi:hypothetical protein